VTVVAPDDVTLGELARRLDRFEREIHADLADFYGRSEKHLAEFVRSANEHVNSQTRFLDSRIKTVEADLADLADTVNDLKKQGTDTFRFRVGVAVACFGAILAAVAGIVTTLAS
jgi:hypothetical protein